ncbi:MAG: FG-GAP repeat domain-containing protein, partial [Rubripirellula sp.]
MPSCRSILALLLVYSLPAVADEVSGNGKWKLNPLAYNNPDLEVDLGVGLWAWPLPMDYDGDGDMDLLVACPDKPSNGVFFFENGTQNPKEPKPVFKPAVRLGTTTHNFQVSFVNGKPRILKPGYEFPRDSATGQFDFSNPVKIYPRTNVHDGGVRANMWRYVDYDGDGDQDLIVGVGDWSDYGWDAAFDRKGNWNNGPLHGYIYLITNEGSDKKPAYADAPTKITAGGSVIDVYGWPSPNFADFDGDGDLDLLCGEFLDGFTYFQNTGSRTNPEYAAGQRLQNRQRMPLTMDLQMITPTAIDWDSDGDIDLITGDEDGRVALLENTGRFLSGAPLFETPFYFQQQADSLKFGALATPFAFDWDQDGDEDILCGNTAGYIGIFENLGQTDAGSPKWSAPRKIKVRPAGSEQPATFRVMAGPSGSIQGPCEAKWGYTTLSVADWNGDQHPDIIYNSIWSRIGLLMGTQSGLRMAEPTQNIPETPPKWYWWNQPSSAALTQWRTTPVAIDFDGDTILDLVALDQQGFLTLRSRGKAPQRIFVDEDNRPIQLNPKSCGSSGRIKLAVVDWDGDGRLDLLVNSENATWYRNCVDRKNKVVLKKIGNLA